MWKIPILRNFILINSMIVWSADGDRCDVSLSTLIFMSFLPARREWVYHKVQVNWSALRITIEVSGEVCNFTKNLIRKKEFLNKFSRGTFTIDSNEWNRDTDMKIHSNNSIILKRLRNLIIMFKRSRISSVERASFESTFIQSLGARRCPLYFARRKDMFVS